jgi:glutathione S-transferase
MDLVLYSYNTSPYARKARLVLEWKGLPFREVIVHPLRRGFLKRKSGQLLVPVLEDGERVVADSTRIVEYLDERYPERPVLPSEPVERARARLLEEWADEGLRDVVQPVRLLIPYNFQRTVALMRSAYPPGRANDLAVAAAMRFVRARYAGVPVPRVGRGSAARYLNRLAEVMDYVDGALAATGYLVGDRPTVADFALTAFLSYLEGLDGWETVRARRRVAKLVKTLSMSSAAAAAAGATAAAPAAVAAGAEPPDAHAQALIDAGRHARAAAAAKKE